MEVSATVITIIAGLVTLLCGAAAGSYFNMKSSRKDILFKRKLEYFEKLSQDLEKNVRLHKKEVMSLSQSSKKKEFQNALTELKKNRKNFFIMASPLYFNINPITGRIISFVEIEKEIFASLENLIKSKNKNGKANNSSEKENALLELNETIHKLGLAGRAIILEMRAELHKG